MKNLRYDYTAVVIGATGGIGSAVATRLRNDPKCGYLYELGRNTVPRIDFNDENSIIELAQILREKEHFPDLIFDATGLLTIADKTPEKTLQKVHADAMAENFLVNAIGPALLIKHLCPLMPRDRPAIFATLSARVGSISDNRTGGWVSYRASKAALNQIVKCAAIELARTKPLSMLVSLQPGTVTTPLSAPYSKGHGCLTPETSARRLLSVLEQMTPERTGSFLDHQGEEIPW